MGIFVNYSIIVCIIFILPALCYSNQTNASKATFYKTLDGKGTPNGACGYGDYGKYVNNGLVTVASSKLYNNGAGCGACYMVTCKEMAVCSYQGTKVMVTDNGEGPAGTDFILSYEAFGRLAKHPGLAQKLFAKGVVDVDYKRVSCNNYENNNLAFKINEHSNYPAYIAFFPINQGGATDILAIQVYEEKSYKWIAMRRAYGAVFDLANPPSGPLKLRIQVTQGGYTKWVQSKKTLIPSYWKPGTIIQTDIHFP
ncbi:hypothetical protein HAX54_003465 [Datura stramonium]|uniref:Expansin-like B1 n=1 Tax=Datura stramonium TaxID=4076 RepID=A0ABS8T665_DATST|nr:hypothetical protein [Datura stramonium]